MPGGADDDRRRPVAAKFFSGRLEVRKRRLTPAAFLALGDVEGGRAPNPSRGHVRVRAVAVIDARTCGLTEAGVRALMRRARPDDGLPEHHGLVHLVEAETAADPAVPGCSSRASVVSRASRHDADPS
jgi:hypothetical protein